LADPKFGPKESCWNCYKLFPSAEAKVCKISGKRFKDDKCLKKWTESEGTDGLAYYRKHVLGERTPEELAELEKLNQMR
jgi:hypothetical protein